MSPRSYGSSNVACVALLVLSPVLVACSSGRTGRSELPAARSLIRDSTLSAIVEMVSRVNIAPLWPGIESVALPYLVFRADADGTNAARVLVSCARPRAEFIPARVGKRGAPVNRCTWSATGAFDGVFALDLAYPVGTDTVTAMEVDAPTALDVESVFHERFHSFQRRRFAQYQTVNETIDDSSILSGAFSDRSERERRILALALGELRSTELKELSRLYLAVRRSRLDQVQPHTRIVEAHIERLEGSAHLFGYEALQSSLTGSRAAAADSIRSHLSAPLESYPAGLGPDWRLVRWRVYATGAAVGLILDRLHVEWRLQLQRGASFPGLLERATDFDPTRTVALDSAAAKRFPAGAPE